MPLDDDLDHAACSLLNTLLGHQVELDVPASRNIVSVIRLCVNRTTPPQDSKELASKAFKYHALLSLIRTALPLLEQKGKQDTALLSDCQNISKTIVETLLLPLFASCKTFPPPLFSNYLTPHHASKWMAGETVGLAA